MKRHHKGHKTDPVKKDTRANAADGRFKNSFERNFEFDNVRLIFLGRKYEYFFINPPLDRLCPTDTYIYKYSTQKSRIVDSNKIHQMFQFQIV